MKKRLSLDGAWQFRNLKQSDPMPAQVPGCVHADLLRLGKIPDPFYGRNEWDLQWIEEEDWEYRRAFDVEADLLVSGHLELVCEGLDTVAEIYVNGASAGTADNMFHAHRFDVKRLLEPGRNEIAVRFTSPMKVIRERHGGPLKPSSCDRVGGREHLRKEQCSFGWDWGPRFASSGICGPIYLEALETNRLESVQVRQRHESGRVTLELAPETARKRRGDRFEAVLRYDGAVVAEAAGAAGGLQLAVEKPRLWWTRGLGGQPLYDLLVVLTDAGGNELDRWSARIGLRELILDQHPDEWGVSFQFAINGVPVFAKGANWIPAHSFITEVTADDYRDLVQSAADANMNMLRVWGGGIYERETFYGLCDELGILVWQDFMFACALYPGGADFLKSVRREAEYQVRRLRHHACLAVWCGNNEIEYLSHQESSGGASGRAYRKTFYELLPDVVKASDPHTAYIPSSPFSADGLGGDPHEAKSGDAHFWEVWHARKPVELYEEQTHRFFSEFGMQAYPHPETVATFTDDPNLFGPDMDSHQKNGGGNATIFEYVSRLYRFPRDYRATAYLSQLNQAYCMKVGVEHFRRNMPRTMGALFWQLNDCWPVASWSSIDFGGRWKALQFAARRFFAPLLVSVRRMGGEELHVSSNTVFSTINGVEIYSVYDGRGPVSARLEWSLFNVGTGQVVKSGKRKLRLEPNAAALQLELDFSKEIARHGREALVLQTLLTAKGLHESQNTTFFAPPKRIDLPRTKPEVTVADAGAGEFDVTFRSDDFLHAVAFYLADGTDVRASDNYFDLFPGQTRTVRLSPRMRMGAAALRKNLRVMSLVDSYA